MSRTFTTDEGPARFNKKKYKSLVQAKAKAATDNCGRGTQEAVYQEIEETCQISCESAKRWAKPTGGGPSDLDMVEKLASYFEVDTYDLLIFMEPQHIEINNGGIDMENTAFTTQSNSTANNDTYEDYSYQFPLKPRKEIPAGADIKWFIRDIYIDLCSCITDFYFDDECVRESISPCCKYDLGSPFDTIREKLIRYSLDLPEEVFSTLNELLDLVMALPLHSEVIEMPNGDWDEESIEYNLGYFAKDMLGYKQTMAIKNYIEFAKSNGHDPYAQGEIFKHSNTLYNFYMSFKEELRKTAKTQLGKYFE